MKRKPTKQNQNVPVTLVLKKGVYTASTKYYKIIVSGVVTDLDLIAASQAGDQKATNKIRNIIIDAYNLKNAGNNDEAKYAETYFTHDPYYSL